MKIRLSDLAVDLEHEPTGARVPSSAEDQCSMVGGEPHQVELLHVRPRRRRHSLGLWEERGPYHLAARAPRTLRGTATRSCSPAAVTQPRGQPASLECLQRAQLVEVDEHAPLVGLVEQERDHAVGTRRGAVEHALRTIDPQNPIGDRHARSIHRGCDTQPLELGAAVCP